MAIREGTNDNETLTGTDENDELRGLGGADELIGLAGDDLLDGGPGADRMEGGPGTDTYIVDDPGDVVIEQQFSGFPDTVRSSVSFTLPDFFDDLILTGTAAINGVGNRIPNLIEGNSSDNLLDGGGGPDTIRGGDGADVISGGFQLFGVTPADSATTTVKLEAQIFTVSVPPSLGVAGFGYGAERGQLGVFFDAVTSVQANTISGPTGQTFLQIGQVGLHENRAPDGTILPDPHPYIHPTEGIGVPANPANLAVTVHLNLEISGHLRSVQLNAVPVVEFGTPNLPNNTPANPNPADPGLVNDASVDYALRFVPQEVTFGIGGLATIALQDIAFTADNQGTTWGATITVTQAPNDQGLPRDDNNVIEGGDGGDFIRGAVGNDLIDGGGGADSMEGFGGADTFRFARLEDIGLARNARDVIADFSRLQGDRIDVSAIDANAVFDPFTNTNPNDAFTFIGTRPFTGQPGEVRFEHTHAQGITVVELNTDVNNLANAAIELTGIIPLTASDFSL